MPEPARVAEAPVAAIVETGWRDLVGEVLKVELACRGLWIDSGKLDHEFEQGLNSEEARHCAGPLLQLLNCEVDLDYGLTVRRQ
jgi:hypothetical protein